MAFGAKIFISGVIIGEATTVGFRILRNGRSRATTDELDSGNVAALAVPGWAGSVANN